MMDPRRRATILALIIFFFFCTAVTASEYPLVEAKSRNFYVAVKMAIVCVTLPSAYLIWKHNDSIWSRLLPSFALFAYVCFGQLYRPLYYMGFFQVSFLYAVAFPVSKTFFRWAIGIGSAAYLWIFQAHWDKYVEYSKHQTFSDIAFAVVAVAILATIGNTFFSSERSFHDDAILRFGQIGMHSARIIHDLKGLIGAPKLHIQYLQSKTKGPIDPKEFSEILSMINHDLDHLKETLVELNRLSSSSARDLAPIALSDLYVSIRNVLSKQLQGIDFKLGQSVVLTADRASITSILVNLVLNSIQTLHERQVKMPRIDLRADGMSIFVHDNAGGFSPGILTSFANNQHYSTRESGSGLGLALAKEDMRRMKGALLLSNDEGGATVELRFSARKRSFLKVRNAPKVV